MTVIRPLIRPLISDTLRRTFMRSHHEGGAHPPASGMKVGFNVVAPYYGASTNSVPFANLMWQAERWQYSGGFWANQDQGITSGNPGTQTLYALIADTSTGTQLPAGIYTFRNPAGTNVAVGSAPGGQDYIAFTTSTAEQTFTLTQNAPLCVTIKGDATNPSGTRTGGIQIILPGHKTSWDAGDYFNSAWVSFHQNAGTQMFRFMDWLQTNRTIATDWANRGTINKINLNSADAGMPWEVIIAAANRFNKPAHINLSARVTDDYVTQFGNLLNSTYTPSQVFIEYCNESWNYANIFSLGWNWVNALTFTKRTVAVDPVTGLCTFTAHGWANDNVVHTTISHAGRATNWWNEEGYYQALWGGAWYLKVISTNTFELWTGAGGTGTKMDLSSAPSGNSGITELLMWNEAEAGKTMDNNGNAATRTKQIADILDAALPGKVKVIIGSQSANSGGVTQPRLANATATARFDYLATAPYYNSKIFAGAVGRTSNTFTPKVWGFNDDTSGLPAPATCYFGVYAQGSTPSIAQVIAGTGTGFVAKSAASWTHTYDGSSTYASGGAVTVVNGTTYTVFFVVTDSLGCTWRWSQDVAAAAVTDTVDVLDTYANQTARALYSLDSTGFHNVFATAAEHKAYIAASVNPAIKLMAYECNSHENYSFPTAVNTWHEAWMGDAMGGGAVMTKYLPQMSAAGFQYANIFLDINGAGPWGIASSTYDITDGRYLAVSAFGGGVPVRTAIDLGAVSATRITAAPGAYPYVAYTFADPTLTYTILGGNNDARWDVSGATVRLLNSTGISYGAPTTYVLKVQATDGYVVSDFDLTMYTGPAPWYESDALIAWNSVTDTDNAAMNLDIGTTMTLAAGAGAVISGGLWDPQGATQYSAGTSGLASGMDMSKPLLAVVVLDRNSATVNGENIIHFGAYPKMIEFNLTSSGTAVSAAVTYAVNQDIWDIPLAASGTARAVWIFIDVPNSKVYYGYNQTQSNTAGGVALPSDWGNPGISALNCFTGAAHPKYGTFEIVNRTGMTLTDVLAIVQKVQNVHGI